VNRKRLNKKQNPASKSLNSESPADPWADAEFEMSLAPGDSGLFERITRSMKGLAQKENKPADKISDNKLNNETDLIKLEIREHNLDEQISEWITEWSVRENAGDEKRKEIRDFVERSLPAEEELKPAKPVRSGTRSSARSILITVTSIAAVITGAFFLIRLLFPADPKKIFSEFYEPFPVISALTRSQSNTEFNDFIKATESYRLKDYKAAAAGFAKGMQVAKTSLASAFCLGITKLESGDYSGAAVLLDSVADLRSEFAKEATWYLGLAYIRSGNIPEAAECFKQLSQSPGFYSERSQKILRRLK